MANPREFSETFKSPEGFIVINFDRATANPSRLERFLAFQCNRFGIAQIVGFRTEKIIGTGDAFSAKTSEFIERISVRAYGFQKNSSPPSA